jgi:hypothetical protein
MERPQKIAGKYRGKNTAEKIPRKKYRGKNTAEKIPRKKYRGKNTAEKIPRKKYLGKRPLNSMATSLHLQFATKDSAL